MKEPSTPTRSPSRFRFLVTASMLAALACVATLIIQIPTPTNGYLHLGDAVVLLCGWLLGPLWGALAAGIGSMLADVFSGFALYAPATFVIKAAVAALAWVLQRVLHTCLRKFPIISLLISALCAEVVMVIGYFAFEATVVGYGWAAAAGIPANAVQAAFGVIVGSILMHILDRTHLRERVLK